jgi:DNA-binding XRE family transcriptional regulator
VKNKEEITAFGFHFRKIRERLNLSQQELADMSNISKITIQRIENAKYCVTIDVLISISKSTGISMEEIVGY